MIGSLVFPCRRGDPRTVRDDDFEFLTIGEHLKSSPGEQLRPVHQALERSRPATGAGSSSGRERLPVAGMAQCNAVQRIPAAYMFN
jgi:hypothetical protein